MSMGVPKHKNCVFLLLMASTVLAQGGKTATAKSVKAFLADCGKKAEAAKTMTVKGKDGWLFFQGELRHLSVGKFWGEDAARVSRAANAALADPLPAIVDYKARLDKLGIELILVPVPPKAVIYPEKISGTIKVKSGEPPPRLDIYHQEFYRLLRQKGIKVIDLVPELMKRRFDQAGAMHCKQDTHWSGRACVLTAKLLAQEIKWKKWYAAIPRAKFEVSDRTVKISGDLWQVLEDETVPKEKLTIRMVKVKTDAGHTRVQPDRASPVILLGDSHCLVFHGGVGMLATGAGLADQLAAELGFPVDLVATRASGARNARINLLRRTRKKGYLDGKKLIIWCFTAREFTEGFNGWGKVPVLRK